MVVTRHRGSNSRDKPFGWVELPRSGAHGKDQQLDLRIEELVSVLER